MLAVLFSAKNCHVRSVNLAEVGEENTHTESLSFPDENDFLKLVVSSRPVISVNFPGNSLFLRFPKTCLAVRKMCIQSSNSQHFLN